MAQNLEEYLAEHQCKRFEPTPHYFPTGDFVTYYFRNDRCYAQRVDDLLTVFRALETRELVGCKIKGVKSILETAGNFGVTINDGDISLGFFFFVGASLAKNETQKKLYEEVGRRAKDAKLDPKELQAA